ncbi:MAG: DUF6751 family protein [Gemmiger sp.]|uniref:DUF6751 family protein n=1 Tax=Gemmiger sp. TaxID=2049027 RepID=UPI002E79E860|nr:DUF6751 family protein [Gemmiger sp.]MEE0800303.1 DUF6751 family protein [Gemmiger sp.]
MQGCNRTVTITHLGYDGDTDSDTEQVQTFRGCSWYGGRTTAPGKDGMTARCVYKCRIPENAGDPVVAVGDKICCGSETATVTTVHDNRGRTGAHLYLEAE